jgi:hypothetical protein
MAEAFRHEPDQSRRIERPIHRSSSEPRSAFETRESQRERKDNEERRARVSDDDSEEGFDSFSWGDEPSFSRPGFGPGPGEQYIPRPKPRVHPVPHPPSREGYTPFPPPREGYTSFPRGREGYTSFPRGREGYTPFPRGREGYIRPPPDVRDQFPRFPSDDGVPYNRPYAFNYQPPVPDPTHITIRVDTRHHRHHRRAQHRYVLVRDLLSTFYQSGRGRSVLQQNERRHRLMRSLQVRSDDIIIETGDDPRLDSDRYSDGSFRGASRDRHSRERHNRQTRERNFEWNRGRFDVLERSRRSRRGTSGKSPSSPRKEGGGGNGGGGGGGGGNSSAGGHGE